MMSVFSFCEVQSPDVGDDYYYSDGSDYDDSSEDDSENRRYIEEQMRLKRAAEAKFQEEELIRKQTKKQKLPKVDYSSGEESSSDGEYIREQLALAQKRQAEGNLILKSKQSGNVFFSIFADKSGRELKSNS